MENWLRSGSLKLNAHFYKPASVLGYSLIYSPSFSYKIFVFGILHTIIEYGLRYRYNSFVVFIGIKSG